MNSLAMTLLTMFVAGTCGLIGIAEVVDVDCYRVWVLKGPDQERARLRVEA